MTAETAPLQTTESFGVPILQATLDCFIAENGKKNVTQDPRLVAIQSAIRREIHYATEIQFAITDLERNGLLEARDVMRGNNPDHWTEVQALVAQTQSAINERFSSEPNARAAFLRAIPEAADGNVGALALVTTAEIDLSGIKEAVAFDQED